MSWQHGASLFTRNGVEGKQVHLVVYTRTSGVIYVDGVFSGSGADASPLVGTGIGYDIYLSNGSSSVPGTMGLITAGFYDRGLSEAEVRQLDRYYQRVLFPADYKTEAVRAKDLWIYMSNSIGKGYYYGNANTPSARMVGKLQAVYGKSIERWYNISKGGINDPADGGRRARVH